ncbi:MAG: hypothetical protein Q8M03_07805 [Legionella sp.]|nr:hypothetical protein [Legionella sp.]
MSKINTVTALSALCLSTGLYAGTMGPINTPVGHPLFTSIEGAYTWDEVDDTNINGFLASKSTNHWGGRIAAGATHYSALNNNLSYTAEMGWGYYSRTRITLPLFGANAKNDIYGLDLLVGVNYAFDSFDLFLKAGGMVQNVRRELTTDLSSFVTGGSVTGISQATLTSSAVVPEVKVGGVYNFNDSLGLSLAYMYVFGNTNVHATTSRFFDGTTIVSNSSVVGSPVALSTVMLGLRYSFA